MFTDTGAGIVITDMDNSNVSGDIAWKLFCIVALMCSFYRDKRFPYRHVRIDNAVNH